MTRPLFVIGAPVPPPSPKRDHPNFPRGSTGRDGELENRGTSVLAESSLFPFSVSFVLFFCLLDDTIMTWCRCAIVYTYTPAAEFCSTMFKHLQYPRDQSNMKSNLFHSTSASNSQSQSQFPPKYVQGLNRRVHFTHG
jgi:hypothetical protein